MSDSIIQSFLDHQFIRIDDHDHIERLTKASAEVQTRLKKKKKKIITYTLVALDPTIADDDPVVGEVEALIIKQWPTFRNSVANAKDTPITYIQAVVLEALNKLSKDESLAAIIWHTGCNIVSHYKLAGQEEVLTHFLLEIGKKVEKVARSSWSIIENTQIDSINPIELTLPKVIPGKVDETEITSQLKAASIHSSWGEGGESTFTPGQNNVNWPKFFSERAGSGLSKVINAALSTQNKSLTSISMYIQESIGSYFTTLKPYLEQISTSILQSSQSLNKRSDLLWWKQALYSQRLDSGYRTLDPLTLAVAMVADLADNVSPIYPKSVDYFLEESIRDVLGDEIETNFALTKLLGQLEQFSVSEKLLLKDLSNENENRKSFGACMADVLKDKMSANEFFKHTGIEKSAKISLGKLAVWLFHDLQANALANKK